MKGKIGAGSVARIPPQSNTVIERREALSNAVPPDILARIDALTESPNGKGWIALTAGLRYLAHNPIVATSPGARGFLDIVIDLASDALAKTGYEALLPLDTLLPNGAIGRKHRTSQSKIASEPRKVTPATRKRILSQYEQRVRDGDKYGAVKALAAQFSVSIGTIHNIIKPKK